MRYENYEKRLDDMVKYHEENGGVYGPGMMGRYGRGMMGGYGRGMMGSYNPEKGGN